MKTIKYHWEIAGQRAEAYVNEHPCEYNDRFGYAYILRRYYKKMRVAGLSAREAREIITTGIHVGRMSY